MKAQLTNEICSIMSNHLSVEQNRILKSTLNQVFSNFSLPEDSKEFLQDDYEQDIRLINLFIAAKRIEGCSENTLKYYSNTLTKMVETLQKDVCNMDTNDLRCYLSSYQTSREPSKVTLDNIRRIMSSFFAWLEDEDYNFNLIHAKGSRNATTSFYNIPISFPLFTAWTLLFTPSFLYKL